MNPRAAFARWRAVRRQARRQPRYSLRWLEYLALAALGGLFAHYLTSRTGLLLLGPALFPALLLCFYTHLLLFRMQCRLGEWCLVIAVLGNLVALLLSIPGISETPGLYLCGVPFVAAMVLAGAVRGLAQAELFQAQSAYARLGLIVMGWAALAGPALLLTGVLMKAFGSNPLQIPFIGSTRISLSTQLQSAATVFIVLGGGATLAAGLLHLRAWRAVGELLLAAEPQTSAAPGAPSVTSAT